MQWKLKHLLIAVAISAILMAWIDARGIISIAIVAVLIAIPVFLAPLERRSAVAAWATVAIPPLFYIAAFYAGWVAVCVELGQRPSFLNDRSIAALHGRVAQASVTIRRIAEWGIVAAVPASVLIASCRSWSLRKDPIRRWNVFWPVICLPIAWIFSTIILACGPPEIDGWFTD